MGYCYWLMEFVCRLAPKSVVIVTDLHCSRASLNISSCLWSILSNLLHLLYTACPQKNAPTPKYNGVVFEILGKHQIFTTEFSTYLYTVWKNSWKFNVKTVFYYVFNYLSKTQVSVTTRTRARSQLSPMKQCDYSAIVLTFFLTMNFN